MSRTPRTSDAHTRRAETRLRVAETEADRFLGRNLSIRNALHYVGVRAQLATASALLAVAEAVRTAAAGPRAVQQPDLVPAARKRHSPIPVRVPADAPVDTVSEDRHLSPDHPLHDAACPACEEQLGHGPIRLVYIGTHPDNRGFGTAYMTGAAVAVHTACAIAPATDTPAGDTPR